MSIISIEVEYDKDNDFKSNLENTLSKIFNDFDSGYDSVFYKNVTYYKGIIKPTPTEDFIKHVEKGGSVNIL